MKRKDEFRGAYAGSGLCLSFAFTDCYADFSRWLNGLNPLILEAEEELQSLRFFRLDDVGKKLFWKHPSWCSKPSSGWPTDMRRQRKRWPKTREMFGAKKS